MWITNSNCSSVCQTYICDRIIPSHMQHHLSLRLGLDKICLAKFEQNGQPKERSNSASKMVGHAILSKKQNGQRMSFEFLDCMALATNPAKLLLDILL